MTDRTKVLFRTDSEQNQRLRVSNGLIAALRGVFRGIDSVRHVKVLHRDGDRAKFFIVLDQATGESVRAVFQAMIQIEDAFPHEHFDYDTVSAVSEHFIPAQANAVLSTGATIARCP